MPHVDFQKAKADADTQLTDWRSTCHTKKHRSNTFGNRIFGTGYPKSTAEKPATIVQKDWNPLQHWWVNQGLAGFRLSTVASLSVKGAQDLCCECNTCPKIKSNSPNFVYHLKVFQKVLMIQASSNHDGDSLALSYEIQTPGKLTGKLESSGQGVVELLPGMDPSQWQFAFEGGQAQRLKIGEAYLLRGNRYLITITVDPP